MSVDRFYKVVLRAPSRARFMLGEQVTIQFQTAAWGPRKAVVRTRWEDVGLEAPLPRELVVEVSGRAPSIDEAMSDFPPGVRKLAPMLAFLANVEVGMLEVHMAFDATQGIEERDFVEVFLPDERGLPTEGRIIEQDLFKAFIQAVDTVPDQRRIALAMAQYDVALRNWFFGGENLALEHLFLAAEALTKVFIRVRCERLGITQEKELARSLGIDVARYGWKSELGARIRLGDVFHDDADTHRAAREASDGFEHGYMDMSEVHRRARLSTEQTFGHVRRAVLGLLDLEAEVRDRIMDYEPRDVRSTRRLVRGRFVGKSDQPAAEGEEYPMLLWESSVTRFWRRGPRDFDARFSEKFTVKCADEVQFEGPARFEIRGRLRPGQQPVDLGPIQLE
jgi:hypothetical protein